MIPLPERYLIVNADDLGASPGITRGILECHARGIVTSASLMVDTAASADAAARARTLPRLSVGLHVDLPASAIPAPRNGDGGAAGDARGDRSRAVDALHRQYRRFVALMGRAPTHIDSHHNVHRDPRLLPDFVAFARGVGLPLRGASSVRSFPGFYGQWAGESHPEHLSVPSLIRMLEREIGPGITELSCHPGYVDAGERTGYAAEREVEIATLCDPAIRAALAEQRLTLVSYHDFDRLAPVVLAD